MVAAEKLVMLDMLSCSPSKVPPAISPPWPGHHFLPVCLQHCGLVSDSRQDAPDHHLTVKELVTAAPDMLFLFASLFYLQYQSLILLYSKLRSCSFITSAEKVDGWFPIV